VPPVLARCGFPFTVALGFILVLLANALALQLAADVLPDDIHIASFADAFLAALVMSAVCSSRPVIIGTNDDDEYAVRVTRRIARRQGAQERTDAPGIIFLEIDGLACPSSVTPCATGAPRHGALDRRGRLPPHRMGDRPLLADRRQPGRDPARLQRGHPGVPLGGEGDGRLMTCSSPEDCEEIERRHATGKGLLIEGGASRGNLLSGEAEETILTVSRTEAEKRSNPGYRAFFANGFNVTRAFVLFVFEIVLEITAAMRAVRRDVRPRGHRGGAYPVIRAGMCVIVRDLIVFGVSPT
jgi:hypothetical protein